MNTRKGQNKKVVYAAVLLSILLISLFSVSRVAADIANTNTNANTNSTVLPTLPAANTSTPDVSDLEAQIRDKQAKIDELNAQQKQFEATLGQKRQESLSLKNQIGILDDQINSADVNLQRLTLSIDTLTLEVDELNLQIQEKQTDIDQQKSRLAELMRVLDRSSNKNLLEITMLNSSLSDFYSQLQYLESIGLEAKSGLEQLQALKTEYATKQDAKQQKLQESQQSKTDLAQKKKDYESQQSYRTNLLADTQNSESQYADLLNQSKQEQVNANADIQSLEAQIRQRLAGNNELPSGPTTLIWPVPSHTITATFHDPNYIFRRYFEHPAIDIAAPQGTPIRAAASGYVARAKNAGMGYSYIMLIHGNNLSTVYGHVSSIAVIENDFVVQGQVIGYSGGTPGTPGAGNLTTGPHLHFEVRLNGIPVNPVGYLP